MRRVDGAAGAGEDVEAAGGPLRGVGGVRPVFVVSSAARGLGCTVTVANADADGGSLIVAPAVDGEDGLCVQVVVNLHGTMTGVDGLTAITEIEIAAARTGDGKVVCDGVVAWPELNVAGGEGAADDGGLVGADDEIGNELLKDGFGGDVGYAEFSRYTGEGIHRSPDPLAGRIGERTLSEFEVVGDAIKMDEWRRLVEKVGCPGGSLRSRSGWAGIRGRKRHGKPQRLRRRHRQRVEAEIG